MSDQGEILQGIGDKWSFLGATLIEWASGFVMFIIISLTAKEIVDVIVPMLFAWIGTTVGLASLRKSFPDEERGLRNALVNFCGIRPMDIPAPSAQQPFWSAAPVRELPKDSRFRFLGLDTIFLVGSSDIDEDLVRELSEID